MSKILLADDSETMGKIIQIILRHHSISFEQSYERKETIENLDQKKYDLLIISSSLKGFHNLSDLKKFSERLKTPPMLLITSRDTEKNTLDYQNEGFPFVLEKPFSARELLLKIKDCGLNLEMKRQEKNLIKKHIPKTIHTPKNNDLSCEDNLESLNFNENEAENTKQETLPQLKDLESKIIENLCNPNNTFFKIIQHMIKEEIQAQSRSILDKQYKEDLKSLIAEYLRGELDTLSEKKKNVTSSL